MAAPPDIAPGAAALDYTITGRPATLPATGINLVVSVLNPIGYLVHETATIPAPEPPAAAIATGSSAPIIFHAEPLDGGFMLGYSTQPDDSASTVEYGTNERWTGIEGSGERLFNDSELAAVLLDGSAAAPGTTLTVTALNAHGESPPAKVSPTL
ncbi:MAG TPA: hypothetical protein VGA56_05110 [Opitutaceae bacterium]